MPKSKAPLKAVILGSINIETDATLKQCIVSNDAEIEEKDQVVDRVVS